MVYLRGKVFTAEITNYSTSTCKLVDGTYIKPFKTKTIEGIKRSTTLFSQIRNFVKNGIFQVMWYNESGECFYDAC